MPKLTLLTCLILHAWLGAHTQVPQHYAADSVVQGIRDLVKELGLKHPGFYRYNTKADFHHYIDSINATITDSLTEYQAYQKIKPIVSRIGCLHTGLQFSKQLTSHLNAHANLFPFQLDIYNNKAYVIKNHSAETTIQPGAELLRINGRSMAEILSVLLPAIPSDGYNTTMKYLALHHSFPTWYRSMIEVTDTFRITTQQGSYTIPAAVYDSIAREGFLKEYTYDKQLDFSVENKIGTLTIRSFSQSAIKKGRQQFKPFIAAAFKELNNRSINNLVIDLRYNTGGSDGNAAFFARHFFDQPFRYWDRIEVTPAIGKSIKGVLTLFYRKPVQKDSTWLWRKARMVEDFNFYQTQAPARNNYKGNVYVLINGFCMSSCADVAAVLHHNMKAIFIGEETGGGYQGNTSGIMPSTTFGPTRLVVTVPLQKYVTAVDTSVFKGHGTVPHLSIVRTVEEVISGKDVVMERTLSLIKKKEQQN